ncbi:hypothetical protein A2U01_0074097, partial [Trifolium medium]|nr:hypothetical protein [Trifolium medium]
QHVVHVPIGLREFDWMDPMCSFDPISDGSLELGQLPCLCLALGLAISMKV